MNVLSGETKLFTDDFQNTATNEMNDVGDDHVLMVEPFSDDDAWVSLSLADQKEGPSTQLFDELRSGIQDLRKLVSHETIDLLEVCAPWDAPLSQAVRDRGVKPCQLVFTMVTNLRR
jgi:hypothetical protein